MKRLTEYTRFHGSMLPVLNDSNRYSAIERLAAIEAIQVAAMAQKFLEMENGNG